MSTQSGDDRFLDDLLTVGHTVQFGIQCMSLNRKCRIYRQKILPWNRLNAFKQLVKRIRPERCQTNQHALGAAQIHICPDQCIFIAGKQDAAVFRAYIGQLTAETQLIGNNSFQSEQCRTTKL